MVAIKGNHNYQLQIRTKIMSTLKVAIIFGMLLCIGNAKLIATHGQNKKSSNFLGKVGAGGGVR